MPTRSPTAARLAFGAQSLPRIYELAGRHEDIARVASEALEHHPSHTGLQDRLSRAVEPLRGYAE